MAWKSISLSTAGRPADPRALKEFCKDYPQASCILMYGVDRPLFIDGIPLLPTD